MEIFFATDDFREKSILSLRLFGEIVGVKNHKHTQIIMGDQDYQQAWVNCARGLLADQGVRHNYTVQAPAHVFSFNKFSTCAYFSGLVFCGHIDALVENPLRELPYRFRDFFAPPKSTLG